MNPSVHICPIRALYLRAETLTAARPAAAVLCTTGTIDPARLPGIRYLHVPFADTTDEKRPDAFRREDAQAIRAFVDSIPRDAELYFCCDSGESRSTALAAAFLHYFGQDEMGRVWKRTEYHPNELVYYLQSAACGLDITREDARELADYNRMLFERQIARQYR